MFKASRFKHHVYPHRLHTCRFTRPAAPVRASSSQARNQCQIKGSRALGARDGPESYNATPSRRSRKKRPSDNLADQPGIDNSNLSSLIYNPKPHLNNNRCPTKTWRLKTACNWAGLVARMEPSLLPLHTSFFALPGAGGSANREPIALVVGTQYRHQLCRKCTREGMQAEKTFFRGHKGPRQGRTKSASGF